MSELPQGLVVRSLSVAFGGVIALDRVDLEVRLGEIVGLIGPNGAGKSTLVNCVGGQLDPTSGSVALAGTPIDHLAPFQRARLGIGRTFQRVALFSELSVQEHLLVALRGGETRRARLSVLVDVVRPSAVEARRIAETLALIGLADRADALVATLPLGACRLLEIGRALVSEPRVLLADEPSSGLDRREAATLAQVLGALPARGVGVLLIEHDLGLVRSVCDRVVVLDVGRLIAEGPFETAIATPQVRRAYLGQGVA